MHKIYKLLKLSVSAVVLSALCYVLPAQSQTKVGFVYVGPVGDHGWTYEHDRGRLSVEKAFGSKVKTTFVEKVPEGADAERVIEGLAKRGHDIIFTTSFGFMNPTMRVAKKYPKVKFEHCSGFKRSDNVATYLGRFYQSFKSNNHTLVYTKFDFIQDIQSKFLYEKLTCLKTTLVCNGLKIRVYEISQKNYYDIAS